MKAKSKSVPSAKRGASKVSLSMVGFFDILGFSAQVEKVKSEPELIKIAGTVESIREHFEFRAKDKNTRELHNILGKQVLVSGVNLSFPSTTTKITDISCCD